MFTRKRILIGGGIFAALLVAAVAATGVWYFVIRDNAPARVSLSNAVSSIQNQSLGQSNADGTATPAAMGGAQGSDLAGTWVLAPNSDSFVGYRVNEVLSRIGSATAVGRTRQLTATLEFDGRAITDAQVTADLTKLQSDQSLRDDQLRRQGLETSKYPSAAFVLTQPIQLDGVPAEGVPVNATATGDLTLHGVTRSVSILLQGQRHSGLVVVIGSLDIQFADFNIAQPRAGSVLSVENHGLLELQLIFQRGTPD
jgi:polyisoprenoid-binding protein YceI